MANDPRSWWALLLLLPCSTVVAQSIQQDTFEGRGTQNQPSELEAAEKQRLTRLKHANATELAVALGTIFESNIKAGQLAILADGTNKSLLIRSKDELYAEVTKKVAELDIEVSSVATAEPPDVHITNLKHANAKELELSLGKIFDSDIRAGQLAIIADGRSNRLIIRSSDELWVRVRKLVAELDIEAPEAQPPGGLSRRPAIASRAQLPMENPLYSKVLSEEHRKQSSIVNQIKEAAKDLAKVKPLRETLTDAVEREFSEQQTLLRMELTKLREKMESLETLLEKRDKQKNQICLKRIKTLLSGQELSEGQPANQDPSFSNSRASTDSMLLPSKTNRNAPLHSNVNINADNIAEEITTILQAELIGGEGMQVILQGKAKPLTNSMLFQLDNRTGRVAYELVSGDEKRMTVHVKLECHGAGQQFWERISGDNIRLSITQEEVTRVTGGQLITKSVYLPKEGGKGQATLISYQMEAGTDVRDKAIQLGQPIVTMTLSR